MFSQFIRYAVVGAVNTGLDFGMYTGLTRSFDFWRAHYLLANAIVFSIVVTWSFFWNKHWTFKNREQKHKTQYAKFVLATLGGIAIAEGVLFAGVGWFGIHDIVSKIIAAPLVVAWNFSAYRFWAFRARPVVNVSEV